MPPKPKFTEREIIAAALRIVSEQGADALTAKSLGKALGSSATPLFTVFSGMEEIRGLVREAAMRHFEQFETPPLTELPIFKQIGMKTVLFAVKEPKLYQLLFMQENRTAVTFDDVFGLLGDTAGLCIETLQKDYALAEEDARLVFENVWIYTFGVGALCANGVCRFSEETLSRMLSTQFFATLQFVQGK